MIIVFPFCDSGDESEGRNRFSEFYAIGPIVDNTKMHSYIEQNTIISSIAPPGPRSYMKGVGIQSISIELVQHCFEKFCSYVSDLSDDYEISAIAFECYPPGKICQVPANSTSFGTRGMHINGILLIRWKNESRDASVVQWVRTLVTEMQEIEARVSVERGQKSARDLGYANCLLPGDRAAEWFGENLPRMREIKRKWDPNQRFNKWLAISPA